MQIQIDSEFQSLIPALAPVDSPVTINTMYQPILLDVEPIFTEPDPRAWHGNFNGRESTLHQLSPYVGKLKSGMATELIRLYSSPGDVVFDPFSGSGVVPFECAILDRVAWGNDLSPYAYTLTRAKLEAPLDEVTAVKRAEKLCDRIEQEANSVDVCDVPEWIQEFYHPLTLREIVVAFNLLHEKKDYFLLGCMLGIMHHVRPGFLSYPASHMTPYLRKSKFPVDEHPKMYEYRDVRSRLIAKVKRAFKRSMLPHDWAKHKHQVWQHNSMDLPIKSGAVDAIISSPPYFGALDYARDNRLRLWFLGCDDWRELDKSLTASKKVYIPQMSECLKEMNRILRSDAFCVLVLGDVDKDGELKRTAEIVRDLACDVTQGQLKPIGIYDDRIPDERRSRRKTRTTEFERILVMQKV